MFLLRVAQLYNKVLLFVWDDPVPIEKFLQPASVDWSVLSPGLQQSKVRLIRQPSKQSISLFDGRHRDDKKHKLWQLLRQGKHADKFRKAKVCVVCQTPCKHKHVTHLSVGFLRELNTCNQNHLQWPKMLSRIYWALPVILVCVTSVFSVCAVVDVLLC
jgi:hypothetical protein